MFPGWIPLPSDVQYDFGEKEGSLYTAAWKVPATLENTNRAKALASKYERYRTTAYLYKDKIEHDYYPDLTIQKANLKGLDSFSNNTGNPFTDSTSGLNVLQNVGYYKLVVEWRQKPWNTYKLKHARIRRSMEGSFDELPGSVLDAYPLNGDPKMGLTRGLPQVVGQQEIQVIYDFVPVEDFDDEHLETLQGKVNSDDKLLGRNKGCILYVNTETEDVIDSLGKRGFEVTHNFIRKRRDWNLVDVTPKPGSTTREASKAYAVIKGLANTDANRSYEYVSMRLDTKLFYYGWEA